MKTRPFNKDQALAGKPVVTRNGKTPSEIHYTPTRTSAYQILTVIDGNEHWHIESGNYWASLSKNEYDLFMLVTPHKELPKGVDIPNGYRLLESGEPSRISCMYWSCLTGDWAFSTRSQGTDLCPENCYIVPDHSTGLWKE